MPMSTNSIAPDDVSALRAHPDSLVVRFGDVFKVANEDERIIEGYASTNDIDEYRDIIEPSAFEAALSRYMQYPMVCLNHDWWNSVGTAEDCKIDNKGLWCRLRISAAEPDLWTKIKERVYRAFSIAGRIIKSEYDDERKIRRITELSLFEISVVGLPANRQARIELARSMHGAILNGNINRFNQEGNMPDLNLGGTPGNQPIDVAALVKSSAFTDELNKAVKAELGALGKNIGEQIDRVTAATAKTAITDALKDESSDLAKGINIINQVKEKVDQGATKAELKELGDRLSDDLIRHARNYQSQMSDPPRGGAGFKAYPIDASSLRDVLRKDAISLSEQRDAQELGLTPIMYRMSMVDPEQLSGSDSERVRLFQRHAQQVAMLHVIMSKSGTYTGIKSLKRYQRLKAEFNDICKGTGMDTETAGEGLEWVPTAMSPELLRRIEVEAVVARLFRRETMPTAAWDWPVQGDAPQMYVTAQATTDSLTALVTASHTASAKVTLNAVKASIFVVPSTELIEDAVFAALPVITDDMVLGMRRGYDNCIINGDADGTHQDTDIEAVTAHGNKLFNGLRRKALAAAASKVDNGGNAINALALRSLRKKLLGARAENPADLAFILSVSDWINLLSDDDVRTVDKFGQEATWLKGTLLAIDAIPIVLSDFVRTDVNNTGVNGASGNTFSTALCVHKDSWATGDRRQLTVKTSEYILTDQLHMVATWRGDFENVRTSNYPATILYNIDPT